jgi:hypothetical protein
MRLHGEMTLLLDTGSKRGLRQACATQPSSRQCQRRPRSRLGDANPFIAQPRNVRDAARSRRKESVVSEADESPHLREEPQSERGPKGSRDAGAPPGEGTADRPAGDPHDQSTGVSENETTTGDTMATGDQGG